MTLEQFKDKLISSFNIKNINDCINKINIYKNFLIKKNQEMNLTRLSDENKIYEQYFYESLEPFININLDYQNVLDIGSGSGIPGIVLKIINPNIKLTIIEANNKRINFLKDLCKLLNFDDVILLNQRAETILKNQIEQFDIVTSRAVANLGILIEISSQYLKVNGLLIEPKSINYENEWDSVRNYLISYGLKLLEIKKLNDKHVVFYFKKISQTDNKYPRTWLQIIKQYKNYEK